MPDLTTMTRQEKFLNGDTDLEPITRREHFYAGRESELPEGHQEPETREEWFIQKYRGGGGDVTVVPLSVTENGTYSEDGKAYSPVSVNVPLPSNAYLLKSVNTPTPIASFNDGEDMVMPSLKVAIEPQQDLHGYDSPWVGGAGKNKCPINSGTITVGDFVTFSTPLPSGTYSFSLKASRTPSSGSYAAIVPYDIDDHAYSNAIGIGSIDLDGVKTIKVENRSFDNGISKLYIYSIAGNWSDSRNYTLTISNLQIELGATATTYAPYSNICPISGWTEAVVTVADDVDNPTVSHEYTIDLDGTRYGGTLDVVSGVLTPAPYYASYNGETLTGEWISDRDKYEVGTTPTIGAQVVNIGASGTPVSIQPTAIKSLRGVNNVYANTGDIKDAEYFSKEV